MKNYFLSIFLITLIFATSGLDAGQPPPPEEIQKTLTTFFNLLKENKIDQAYETVLVNTKIKGREDEVKALKKQTYDAIKMYGPIMGFEVIEQKRVGMSLLQVVCLSWTENVPLRWRFSYYRPGDRWKLLNILVDDRIDELFEANPPSNKAAEDRSSK
jgi:hypothetical protein